MKRLKEASRNPLKAGACLAAFRRGDDPDVSEDAAIGAMLEGAALGSQIAWADEKR